MKKYSPKKIESKWQQRWAKEKLYQAKDFSRKPKKYILVEFPYPSGAGLHVGHVRSYTALDVVARKLRMEGYNVMYPIGWDAFGLPTENYALKHGIHPRVATEKNIATFKRQLKSLGLSYDWTREINTTDPKYYKWTQWIFLKLYEKGLAYKKKMPINWCPGCKIGLANEEVINGRCERCSTLVEKREKEQWMLKITKYADRLSSDLDKVDYAQRIKTQQKNWIGRSEGAEVDFAIDRKNNYVLLHGYKGSVKENFFPWLKKTLEKKGCEVTALDLPGGENPKAEEQIEFLKDNCNFNENTIVVTHSLGGPLLMKYLESTGEHIYKAILLAPPSKVKFRDNKPRTALKKYCDWVFDFKKIRNQIGSAAVLVDTTDPVVPASQPQDYIKGLNAKEILVESGDHFDRKEVPQIIEEAVSSLKVFTTRPDTLYGATYMVVAPELAGNMISGIRNEEEVKKYIDQAKKKSDLERTDLAKEKTGVELKEMKAINPVNGEKIPIWVADYVLSSYGTGAIMAVPAHDERDFEFANKYKLPIRQVVAPWIDPQKEDTPRHDKETIRRDNVIVVVKHWKDDKYYCLDWKKYSWKSFVVGGIEKGEDPKDAALREAKEESGYQNFKNVKKLGGPIATEFFAKHKNINRQGFIYGYYIELADNERKELEYEHTKHHQGKWIEKDKVMRFVNLDNHRWFFRVLQEGEEAYTGDGVNINSALINGLKTKDAKEKIIKWIEKEGRGRKSINYKLRDWIFSRQRYWGEPIPIIHCEKCGMVPVSIKDLPVELPVVKKYQPTDEGDSPLARANEWVNTKCPKCKGRAKRETDVMPNWAGSSWYFLRYCDPKNDKQFAEMKKLKYWMPIDWYNGGMEHTTLHLLYSRFWNKFLYDYKFVPASEPYVKRTSHGIVLAEDGRKMSKSFGNVINPDDIVENEEGGGADTLRMYEMFMGPFADTIPWSTDGVKGVRRFIERVWEVVNFIIDNKKNLKDISGKSRLIHKTIKEITKDIDNMKFNTAVSKLMIQFNGVDNKPDWRGKINAKGDLQDISDIGKDSVDFKALEDFLILLSPFAPHLSEELWEKLGHQKSIFYQEWPKYNDKLLIEEEVELVVQINGKLRDRIRVKAGMSEKEAISLAKKSEKVNKYIKGRKIKKAIYISDKLLNLVV